MEKLVFAENFCWQQNGPGVTSVESDQILFQQLWYLTSGSEIIHSQDSNNKRKFTNKVTEVEKLNCRRNGFRKQVIEAKEGPLELRKKRVSDRRGKCTWESGWGKAQACSIERTA